MKITLLLIILLGVPVRPGSSRTLLEDGVTFSETQAVAADPAGPVTPDILRCQWKPERPIAHGVWPESCMGMPIGDPCVGRCKPGYQASPFPPTVYCNPSLNTDRWGQWGQPEGACVKIPVKCQGVPCCVEHGKVDKKNCTGDEPGDTCTATCDPMYSGDPDPPKWKCVYRPDKRSAYWRGPIGRCKLEGPCRAAPCRDIAFAIPDSCAQTWGFKDFTCTCNDFYRWNHQQKICEPANLLSFSVLTPVDESTQGSYIYKYMATKSSQIGRARWQVQDAGTTPLNLNDVAIADATTAWAVGSSGLIKKYDGTKWSIERAGTEQYDLLAAASIGSNKAWIGGTRGVAFFWDGSTWTDISIGRKQTVWSIAAVSQADEDIAWMVASDETDPNNIVGYIYKWSQTDKRWIKAFDLPDVTLRGVTVLDKDGAWACGFSIKGPVQDRGWILMWNSTASEWQRATIMRTSRTAALRLLDIHAVDYRNAWAVGYLQESSPSGGDLKWGIVLSMDPNYDLKKWGYRLSSGSVEMFNAISGASPSTTVAVGQNKDAVANQELPGELPPRPLRGYPAENWQRLGFSDTIPKPNGSVPADVAFKGVAVKYVAP